MADFHIYDLTITARVAVPATVTGDATTFSTTGIPKAVGDALATQLAAVKPVITVVAVALDAPVEFPLAAP